MPKHYLRSIADYQRFRLSPQPFCQTLLYCLPLALVAGGCGGPPAEKVPTDQPSDQQTVAEPAPVIAPTDSAVTVEPAAIAPSGPAMDAGMQLPSTLVTPDPSNEADNDDSASDPGGPAQPGDGGIEMPSVQFESWPKIEAHAKSTGTVTVVDLWSTVCAPCVKEFPGLVRLSERFPDTVTCIGVSVDFDGRKSRPPEYYAPKVQAFLKAVGAGFENFVCDTPSDDVFAQVGIPSIPAVLVFDADGKLLQQFVDSGDTIGFSYDSHIIPLVEKLAG